MTIFIQCKARSSTSWRKFQKYLQSSQAFISLCAVLDDLYYSSVDSICMWLAERTFCVWQNSHFN